MPLVVAVLAVVFLWLLQPIDAFHSTIRSNTKSRLYQLLNDNIREKLLVPSDRVMEAIEVIKDKVDPSVLQQGNKNSLRVSVSDIASLAAVDFSTAKRNLITLALLTEGDLDVTNDGEVIYSFPTNFKSILYQKSLINKLRSIYLNYVEPPLAYSLRISFGIMLLASLVIVFISFVASSSTSSSSSDRDRDDRRGVPSMNLWIGNSPFDVFYYRGGGVYIDYDKQVIDYYRDNEVAPKNQMGFLESFYSYIFGDGDPNTKVSAVSLQAVANVIRRNNGTVVAEQIAPFLNPPKLDKYIESGVADESFVLPVLLTYDGVPNVLPTGDIVYTFQELMVTAGMSDSIKGADVMDNNIYEKKVPFSLAPKSLQFVAGGLGLVNLLGVFKIGTLVSNPQFSLVNPGLFTALTKIYPFLFVYAVLYNAIPLFRFFKNRNKNNIIEERNRNRVVWRDYLKSRNDNLINKMNSARKYIQKTVVVDEADVFYSTKPTDDKVT